MSLDRCNPHPIQHDGTSQRQRAVEAQAPENNPVDGRSLAELISYAERYAKVLQYWNNSDVREGDWRGFLKRDISTLIAHVLQQDIPKLRSDFEQQSELVETMTGPGLARELGELYGMVLQIALRLDEWYRNAPTEMTLYRELSGWIASTLGEAMRTVVAQAARARSINPRVPELESDRLHSAWQVDGVLPDTSLFSHGRLNHPEDLTEALIQMAQAHGQFLMVLEQLLASGNAFMEESLTVYPNHQPHMALLLAFLQLFGHAQQHLNSLTAKHLQFYYRRVLGLKPADAIPDQAHLVIEPAKILQDDPVVAAATAFKGGKDASGVALIYNADEELVLNQAQVDEQGLKSVYVALDSKGEVENIYAATDADSADGLGADLETEDGQWHTFGNETMPYATLGFAVASPMLCLAEGDRTITIRFYLQSLNLPDGIDSDSLKKELRLNITAEGSGEKGWVEIPIHEVTLGKGRDPCLEFRLFLDASEAALTAYNSEVHEGGYDTTYPVVRFVLDNEGLPASVLEEEVKIDEPNDPPCELVIQSRDHIHWTPEMFRAGLARRNDLFKGRTKLFDDKMGFYDIGSLVKYKGTLYRSLQVIEKPGFRPVLNPQLWQKQKIAYPYRYLKDLVITGLKVSVKVRGMRNLILENDQGILDPAKPFMPFGAIPKAGSAFLIGSSEVFSKTLDSLRLDVTWVDLPQETFLAYYSEYGDDLKPTDNQYFTANAEFLKDGAWQSGGSAEALFSDIGGGSILPSENRCFSYPLKESNTAILPRNRELGNFSRYQAGMRQGFMRFQLNQSFGHAAYPIVLAKAAISPKTNSVPNAPYTPQISGLTLGYEAHEEIDFQRYNADAELVEKVFQLWPFGYRQSWPAFSEGNPVFHRLLPHFEVTGSNDQPQLAQGTLYVGFNKLDLSAGAKNLSLLVQLAEGSADPELPVEPVVWSYLVDDEWHDFKSTEILADGTNGLLRSGIIRFAMPKTMSDNNSLLPAGVHWIKVSVARNSTAVCKLIALHTQALTVTMEDQGNDPTHLATPLAAGTISKLKERLAAVKKVAQPYASFGGRMAENDSEFNVRVSERLRHKGRAVTLFDYERLVLQQFPDIYKVKCINHSSRQQEHVPGSVRVIVVPDLRNRNAVDPLKPMASLDTLDQIHDYLDELTNDFTQLEVSNPDYEAIRVQFQVRFHQGYDEGYYLSQVVQDIQDYLSPWLHDDSADIRFGGTIHRSKVLLFVEQLAYVDFVTEFRMDQQVADSDSWLLDVEEAVASNAGAVLVSAPAEAYQIGTNIISCEDLSESDASDAVPQQEMDQVVLGPRYLGNTSSRELHDLNRLTSRCHIDKIDMDRRYRFYTVDEAQAMGYDLCAHCFGRELSKR